MKTTVYQINTPVSIVLLTDTHNRDPKPIIHALREHRPEMIAVAGDLVIGRPPITGLLLDKNENVLPLLQACAEIAPTFVSLGNHEGIVCDEDLDLLRSSGVTLLDNNWCEWNGIIIGGLTSPKVLFMRRIRAAMKRSERYPTYDAWRNSDDPAIVNALENRKKPDLAWLPEFEARDGFKILLAHEPHLWEPYLRDRIIDLILSGHAHGGQWRFFGHGIWAPDQGLFPKYTSGIHENLIISRGLANTAAPIPRIFNPTELVILVNRSS